MAIVLWDKKISPVGLVDLALNGTKYSNFRIYKLLARVQCTIDVLKI